MVKRLNWRGIEPSTVDRQVLRTTGTPKVAGWTEEITHSGPGNHAARPAASAVAKNSLYSCTEHNLIYKSDGVSTWTTYATLGGQAYATIKDEGTSLTQRSVVDFVGPGVVATDDATNSKTVVTINATGSGGGTSTPYGSINSGLLATQAYNPASVVTTSTTSTTPVDIDATNLAITFVAPASGSVIVRFNGNVEAANQDRAAIWYLREGSTTLFVKSILSPGNTAGTPNRASAQATFKVTGLTPGNTYTYKWSHSVESGGTAKLTYGGGSASSPGAAIIEVWDAAPSVLAPINTGTNAINLSGLLGRTSYCPVSPMTFPITTTTLADVDATNLAVTFTAPASGKVSVRLSSLANVNGNLSFTWSLRDGTTNVAQAAQAINNLGSTSYQTASVVLSVTGLTPGVSYTYKWSAKVSSGTGTILAGDDSGASRWGPAVMEVWDAAPQAFTASGAETWEAAVAALGGKVHRWKFDEASGTTVADSVGSLPLTMSGTYTRGVPGISGSAATTFGAGSKAESTGLGSLPTGATPLTIVTLFKTTAETWAQMVTCGWGPNGTRTLTGQYFNDSGTTPLFGGYNSADSTYVVECDPGDANWHLGITTFDGLKGTSWIDGKYKAVKLGGAMNIGTTGNFKVGQDTTGTGSQFLGDMDEVIVFNRALKAAEKERLWNALYPPQGLATNVLDANIKVRRTTNQSITDATSTAVTFDSEDQDLWNAHDNSTNPSRITIPSGKGGTWRFLATVEWAAGATGYREIVWKRNGTVLSTDGGSRIAPAGASDPTIQTTTLETIVAPGDYIEVFVKHTQGTALNVATAQLSAHFMTQAQTIMDHGVSLRQTTGHVVPSGGGAAATMAWASAKWDTDGYFSSATPTRITIPAGMGGKYLVIARASFDSATSFEQVMLVTKNGTEKLRGDYLTAAHALIQGTGVMDLSPGDYIEAAIFQGSGSNKTVQITDNMLEFTLHMLPQSPALPGASTVPSGVGVTRDDLAANYTSATTSTWNTVTGLAASYTTPSGVSGKLLAVSRIRGSGGGNMYVRLNISPTAVGGAPNFGSSFEGLSGNLFGAALVGVWDVAAGTTYTVQAQEYHSSGTATIYGGAGNSEWTQVELLFIPDTVQGLGTSAGGLATPVTETSVFGSSTVVAPNVTTTLPSTYTVTPTSDVKVTVDASCLATNSSGAQGAYLFVDFVHTYNTDVMTVRGVSPTTNQVVRTPLASTSVIGEGVFWLKAGRTYTLRYFLKVGSGAGSVTFTQVQSTVKIVAI